MVAVSPLCSARPSRVVAISPQRPFSRRMFAEEARPAVFDAIEQHIKENPITVFMKGVPEAPECGFSNNVCRILDMEGVEYKGINVLTDADLRQGIKQYSEWPTIPQVYVKGEFIGGCDLLTSMYRSGELREKLIQEGLAPPEE